MVKSSDSHPIWISGVTVLGSGSNQEMFGYFAEMQSLGSIFKSGYLKWNDSQQEFQPVKQFSKETGWRFLDGHVNKTFETAGNYVIGGFPCTTRVMADDRHLMDPSTYEAFTCLNRDGTLARDEKGAPKYRWQKEVEPIGPQQEQDLISEGKLNPSEAHFLPIDANGDRIFPHGGCVHWNPYRRKWIAILTRFHGKDSELGEIYYSESEAPTGPYQRAVKICTHGDYTFYNPVHHEFLDRDGGRTIYFEGTYTSAFSGNKNPTPRYNYNQLLYRLDLADPRLSFGESARHRRAMR